MQEDLHICIVTVFFYCLLSGVVDINLLLLLYLPILLRFLFLVL
jgi:hypothetical protein